MKTRRIGLITLFLNVAMIAHADEPSHPAPPMPAGLADQVLAITDTVLAQHIDPPTRQEMLASAMKSLHRAAGLPTPLGLGRQLSAISEPAAIEAWLHESWPKTIKASIDASRLQDALFQGLLAVVPGPTYLMPAKEAKVAEQMAGNRYVGIHIALGMDQKAGRPTMHEVFPRGPAGRAGVKADDLLEAIEGIDTKGMSLRDVVDRLRGDEGTDVTITVRQPNASTTRTYTITRGQLPRVTIEGIRERAPDDWTYRLDGPDPIGYLKIKEISASTPHELRRVAERLQKDGVKALVIDLRGRQGNSVDIHPAVLLADSLLESGTIGRLRTARGETIYQADPDALFVGWPIAVLVDQKTTGTSEWVAMALQDNHRAIIIGMPTPSSHMADPRPGVRLARMSAIHSNVPVGDGQWWISLATGYLERGDGRPLTNRENGMMMGRRARRPPQDRPKSTPTSDPDIQAAVKVLRQELEKR